MFGNDIVANIIFGLTSSVLGVALVVTIMFIVSEVKAERNLNKQRHFDSYVDKQFIYDLVDYAIQVNPKINEGFISSLKNYTKLRMAFKIQGKTPIEEYNAYLSHIEQFASYKIINKKGKINARVNPTTGLYITKK